MENYVAVDFAKRMERTVKHTRKERNIGWHKVTLCSP